VLSFDAASAFIIAAMMLATGTALVFTMQQRAGLALESQALNDRVFAVSDYLVKEGAVRTTGNEFVFSGQNAAFHHEIDGQKLGDFDVEAVRKRLRMNSLTIEWKGASVGAAGQVNGSEVCVTRLCAFNGEIESLKVCGS
jgi:hypothetical protein